jgi:hypothetical protein
MGIPAPAEPLAFLPFHSQQSPRGALAIPAQGIGYPQQEALRPDFGPVPSDWQRQSQVDHATQIMEDIVSPPAPALNPQGSTEPGSGRLQPVKVIDTPQGLYALYDKNELLAYKQRFPTLEVPVEATSQDASPLYPLWSGGHPPEKQWMNPSNEMQYRQNFQQGSRSEPGGDHIVFPPTPGTSTLDQHDRLFLDTGYVDSARKLSNASEEGTYSIEIKPAPWFPQQSPSFIHHPIPLPRQGTHRDEFNIEVPSPATPNYPMEQVDHSHIRMRTPLRHPGFHRPHEYTASVRIPSRYQPQEGDAAVTQRYRSVGLSGLSNFPSAYRGTGSNRRGLGRRGMQGNHGYNAYAHMSHTS